MLKIGSVVDGKYKILNVIGRGGMSVVYLAMNERANKQWAIKEVRRDGVLDYESVRQGLIMETNMLKKLSHPNLPSIVDVIEDADTFLIVMDYIQGNSLSRTLEEQGAQSQESVIHWAKQLCDVLGYLHTRTPAIIYRDMKPANIMLKPDGNIVLIDFGIAREFNEKKQADTSFLGTIGYAAPEQFGGRGQTDARTDIYCLGTTLYHLVTGRNPSEPPYEIRPIREINPELSGGLEKILIKCMRNDPKERYQSAAELAYALEHYREMEVFFRKKQCKRLAIFLSSAFLTVALGAASLWGNLSAKEQRKRDYDFILQNAVTLEQYYMAILTDPSRVEAYLRVEELLIADGELSPEEMKVLRKFPGGLEQVDKEGFTTTVNVLEKLRSDNPEGYQDVCYTFGEACLFYYNVAVEKDRYANAAEWFCNAVDRYPNAKIYCDISDCLNHIYQFQNTKIKQTYKLYEEYGVLWDELGALLDSVEEYEDVDSMLQVWRLAVQILSENAADFMEVTDAEALRAMLDRILAGAEMIERPVLEGDIRRMQTAIHMVQTKIDVLGGDKGDI